MIRIFRVAQRWQTFGTGLIALVVSAVAYRGAKLAYNAAMAKVDADREAHREDLRRQRVGVGLRLRFATIKIISKSVSNDLLIRRIPEPDTLNFQRVNVVPNTELFFIEPTEFAHTWEKLELLTVAASLELDALRNAMNRCNELATTAPQGRFQIYNVYDWSNPGIKFLHENSQVRAHAEALATEIARDLEIPNSSNAIMR